ncbi:M61 family metallopeptidase [Candidatus Riflebacteria bacterium]
MERKSVGARSHGVHYYLSFPAVHSQFLQVKIKVPGWQRNGKPLRFFIPRWTPGWYSLEENARYVINVNAFDSKEKKLPIKRVKHFCWEIENVPSGFCFCYEVFGGKWADDGCYVSEEHISFLGTTVFAAVEGFTQLPHFLHTKRKASWKHISTGLKKLATNFFQAADYDELIDCPVEIGNHPITKFNANRIPFELAWVGPVAVPCERDKVTGLIEKASKQIIEDMHGAPFKDYVFIMHITPTPEGSLEHRNSCSLTVPKDAFFPRENMLKFLTLLVHEFFHAWNVKSIRPKELMPLDYMQEQHTDLLWFFEGFTSYFESLFMLRSGLMSEVEFFKTFCKQWYGLESQPGQDVQTLNEASFYAWIKYNGNYKNQNNLEVDFYLKGMFVGFCADMELLRLTRAKRSLLDVMRFAYKKSLEKGYQGLDMEDLLQIFQKIGSKSFKEFFKKMVDSTERIPINRYLKVIGCKLIPEYNNDETSKKDPHNKNAKEGGLALSLQERSGRVYISEIARNSSATKAGLYIDDEIIALNQLRVGQNLKDRIKAYKPGSKVTLTVARQEKLMHIPITVETAKPSSYKITHRKKISQQQRNIFAKWSNGNLNKLKS